MSTDFVRKVTETLITAPDVAVAIVVTVSMRPDSQDFEMDVSIRGGTMHATSPQLLKVAEQRLKAFCDAASETFRELADQHLKHETDTAYCFVDDAEHPERSSKKAKA